MKNFSQIILAFGLGAFLFASCSTSDQGQLVGVQDRPSWDPQQPFGMVYVPSGVLHIGQSSQDIFSTYTQRNKSISINGFYMDDSEITNNEYRQFTKWAKDSIAHVYLDHFIEDDFGNSSIDWEMEIDWNDEALAGLFHTGDDAFGGKKEFDTGKLVFEYKWKDWRKAATNPDASRSSIIKSDETNIYPDTLCWIRDFSYSYNEPMTRNYYWHPGFDDYPVVGVSWKMAKAFSYWRTKLWNKHMNDQPNSEDFRLPTEWEFEYAARGGQDLAPYPWGAYYTRNAKGCLLANFKPGRGNYPEDGGMYTVNAYAYDPNDYGLYNMSGNVAEWTESSYSANAYEFISDMNPDIKYDAKPDDHKSLKRKTIKGGSWKDVSYYLQTGTRHWEYQDTTQSYIGFRNVLTQLGRAVDDFQ